MPPDVRKLFERPLALFRVFVSGEVLSLHLDKAIDRETPAIVLGWRCLATDDRPANLRCVLLVSDTGRLASPFAADLPADVICRPTLSRWPQLCWHADAVDVDVQFNTIGLPTRHCFPYPSRLLAMHSPLSVQIILKLAFEHSPPAGCIFCPI